MSVRFECPRCQTVFDEESADAAFAECPSCGALALAAAEPTSAGVLQRALSQEARSRDSVPDGAPLGQTGSLPSNDGFAPQPSGSFEPTQVGVFAGLVQEAAAQPSAEAPAGDVPLSRMLTRDDAPPTIPPDRGIGSDDDAHVHGQQTMPASMALTRGEPDVRVRTADSAGFDDPTMAVGVSLGSLDDEPPAPPPAPAPQPTQQMAGVQSDELGRIFDDVVLPPTFDAEISQRTTRAPAPRSQEGEFAPTDPSAPWKASLSEEAFQDLERAFDDIALKPPEMPEPARGAARPPPMKRKGGNAWAELMGVEQSGEEELPRPPDKPKPPPLKLQKRRRPDALALSDDAKRVAFLPLGRPASEPATRPPQFLDGPTEEVSNRRAAPRADKNDEVTTPEGRPAPKQGGRKGAVLDRPPTVPAFAGFTAMRVAAGVIFMLLAGGALGAYLAPSVQKANTPRARAEQKFIEGNKSYVEGRYDDAVGYYKGAISVDPTFALAHRAKGAALVKQQKYDEAAEAYRQYLALQPDAIDARDVKEVLAKREGKKTDDGG